MLSTRKERWCDSCGGFGTEIIPYTLSAYLMVYHTNAMGISAKHSGALFLVARILDAFAKQFLEIKGMSRNAERMKITTEQGRMLLPYCYGGDPRDYERIKDPYTFWEYGQMYIDYIKGRDPDYTAPYRDWELSKGIFYLSPNPDIIYLECDGEGLRTDSRLAPKLY